MSEVIIRGAYGPVGALSRLAPDEIAVPVGRQTAIRVDTSLVPATLYVDVQDVGHYEFSPHSVEDLNVMCKDVLRAYDEFGCSSLPPPLLRERLEIIRQNWNFVDTLMYSFALFAILMGAFKSLVSWQFIIWILVISKREIMALIDWPLQIVLLLDRQHAETGAVTSV